MLRVYKYLKSAVHSSLCVETEVRQVKRQGLKTWIQTEEDSAGVRVLLLGLERCC